MYNNKFRNLLEATVIASLASILSSIIPSILNLDVSFGLILILLFSLRRGLKYGLLAGLIWGILPILFGRATILTLTQGILEYPIANLFAGFAGIFFIPFQQSLKAHNQTKSQRYLISAVLLGSSLKYLCHFIAGVIFWGRYAQWNLSPLIYSLVINGTSALINIVFSSIILLLLLKKAPFLFS